ncbi:MAG: hypothetical protein IIY12_00095, partial [Clostridia bacterium]|nr:hypothetical protein [Clostridia bacterium]
CVQCIEYAILSTAVLCTYGAPIAALTGYTIAPDWNTSNFWALLSLPKWTAKALSCKFVWEDRFFRSFFSGEKKEPKKSRGRRKSLRRKTETRNTKQEDRSVFTERFVL